MLAILRDYFEAHLGRVGQSGQDLVFGRTAEQAFYALTVDGRAKRAWEAANEREHESAAREGRKPDLLRPIGLHICRHTFASLLIDSGANPKAIQEFMGHSKFTRPSTSTATFFPVATTRSGCAWTPISLKPQSWASSRTRREGVGVDI